MKSIILSFILVSFFGCRPEQEATDWNITIAPQSGTDTTFETDMNTALKIEYSIPSSEKSISEQLVMVRPPENGSLSDCKQTNLSMSCLYNPNEGFFGSDKIMFKVKDGDFESENYSYLTITVHKTIATPGVPDIVDIVLSCADAKKNGSLLTQTSLIHFDAVGDCAFNENSNNVQDFNIDGNGPRINGKVQARVEQYYKLKLPSLGTICDIDFIFPETTMQYDDEILLTVNNFVVMSSQNYSEASGSDHYSKGLRINEDGLMVYNWIGENSLYNLHYGQAVTPKYCLGVEPSDPDYNLKCNIPPTETNGQFKLDIPNNEIIKIGLSGSSLEQASKTEIDFGFISTGDNDNGDCEHSEYNFNVSVKYMN
jgi:hypothetical protein